MPLVDQIKNLIALHYGVSPRRLCSPGRAGRGPNCVAAMRAAAMLATRQLTKLSLQEIGMAFGGRHHTTVLAALDRAAEDPEAIKALAFVRAKLNEEKKA